MAMNTAEMELKWQERWREERVFEAEPGNGEKYFLNVPYPYINGLLHIGHTLTYSRTEFMARYKRLRGYNVLFPYAFHATGTPIVAAAGRVADGEESQMNILRSMDIPEDELSAFSDPLHWVEYFPIEAERDLNRLGVSVDWRRKFMTTSLNPAYDAFIRWQFNRLHEQGLVRKGRHPVVWCTHDNSPVGDHARIEGEGEMPQEFVLLKFEIDGEYIVAATLRPETVFGQTNLWVDPEEEYVKADVDGEVWILSKQAAQKLSEQKHEVATVGSVFGSQLLGKEAVAPMIRRPIPILPSSFCDPEKGTGIVTSVPSDAPDDWIALVDIKADEAGMDRYGLDPEMVRSVEPIAIITSEGWGDFPAGEIVERMGIKDQTERDKLLEAKHVIYRSGFYTGVMREVAGEYAGMPVEEAKDRIRDEMLEKGEAALMFELSNPVVCRCLTPSIVKVVDDQWFIAYGDHDWKARARECLAGMNLYPEVARKQFEHVLGWLRDWACTRELGLGTKLPWDDNWMVESLSDSTIYMAYYTISHIITDLPEAALTDSLFDHVFLGKSDAATVAMETGTEIDTVERMREEFLYWYPFDLRVSGKDLIQNHLSFTIFNHTAIFPQEHWPRGFGTNGWILIGGQKMSKSSGSFRTLRSAIEEWSADAIRFTLAYGGDGLDDPNFDPDLAGTIGDKFNTWLEFAQERYGKGVDDERAIDRWFRSALYSAVEDYCDHMDLMEFRAGVKRGYYDLQRDLRWYLRRCDEPNRSVISEFIKVTTQMLSVFAPHVSEEVWETIGRSGFVSVSQIPDPDPGSIDSDALDAESVLVDLMDDLREVLGLVGDTPGDIHLYTAADWKWHLADAVRDSVDDGVVKFQDVMSKVMSDPEIRKNGKVVPPLVKRLIQERASYGIGMDAENEKLSDEADFLSQEFGRKVHVWTEGQAEDPMGKAKNALPYKPAIFIGNME